MKINLHSPIEEVQVQIIPLIDVIFCILTFFLLAALQFTRQQAINVDLPRASTGTQSQFQSRLIVSLNSSGQIFVEQNPVNLDRLAESLREYFRVNPFGIVVLNASRLSSYNEVIQVLDAMRQVGGDRVALATIAGSPDRPAGSSPDTIPLTPLNPSGTSTPPTTPSTPSQFGQQGSNFGPVPQPTTP
jgi:biopolymer transport protein ExbD